MIFTKYTKFLEALRSVDVISCPKNEDSYHFLESYLKNIISKENEKRFK
jgi:hypothetical protein